MARRALQKRRRRAEREMSGLCLHIPHAAMVLVNTFALQDVLPEDEWSQLLTGADERGLTPLIWGAPGHARRIQTEPEPPPRPHQSVSGSACVSADEVSSGGGS